MKKEFLRIKNVSLGYQNPLIEGVNTSLELGDVCLLIGNNGVGKTTLIKSILGQISLICGSIEIEDLDIYKMSLSDISKKITVVFSKALISENLTVFDLVSLGKFVHYPYYFSLNNEDKIEVEKVISELGLEEYKNFPVNKLSDGNFQKALIGRALIQNTKMIILDEPTTFLDEENKVMILSILRKLAKEKNKVILFSSHDWRLAKEFSDKIWWITNKTLQSGFAEDFLLQHKDLIDPKYYSLSDKFISPKINAPELEKEMLFSALQKNFNQDLSFLIIDFTGDLWHIHFDNEIKKVSSLNEIVYEIRRFLK